MSATRALRSCLTDRIPQDILPTSWPGPLLSPLPQLTSLYPCTRDCFSTKGLLLIEKRTLLCLIICCPPETSREREPILYHLWFFREKKELSLCPLSPRDRCKACFLSALLLKSFSKRLKCCLFVQWLALLRKRQSCCPCDFEHVRRLEVG